MVRVSSTTHLYVSSSSNSFTSLTKALAKEVAPFNTRALTVVLGTFNTNMATPPCSAGIPSRTITRDPFPSR